jgi:hypothetical protein
MKAMGFLLIIPILVGWIGGLIVNYLADVLPVKRRFSTPACVSCGRDFSAAEYLLFRPCSNCNRQRSTRTWLVQLFMLIVSLYAWFRPPFDTLTFHPPFPIAYTLGMILLIYFAMVFVIDLEHRLILHPTSVFGALFGLGLGMWLHGIISTLLGGLIGLLVMLVFYYFGVLFARYRAKQLQAAGQDADDEEALGFGDVILAGILGLILGWRIIGTCLLVGILLGGVIGIIFVLYLMISKRYKTLMVFIPYGPFFITSAFLLLFLPTWLIPIAPK